MVHTGKFAIKLAKFFPQRRNWGCAGLKEFEKWLEV